MKEILLKICRILILLGLIATTIFYFSSFISHCEENNNSSIYYPFASDVPLRVASDMGFPPDVSMSDSLMQSIIDDVNSGNYPGYNFATNAGFNDVNLVLFREYASGSNQLSFYVFKDGYIDSFDFPSDFSQSSLICNFRSLNNYFLIVTYDFDDDAIVAVRSTTGNAPLTFYPLENGLCWIDIVFSDPILGTTIYGLKTNKAITNYPIFLRDDELSYNGLVRFSSNYSAGGGSSVTDEIIDNIDGSEDLPQIDDDVPSDATDNAILRKILSSIKTFLKNVQGIGVTTIYKITDLKDSILEALDDIKQLLSPASDEDLKNAWISGFSNWALYPAIMDVKGLGNTLSGVFDVAPVDTLVFTIRMPFFSIPSPSVTGSPTSVKLFGDEISLDFGWYAQPLYFGKSPRDIVTDIVIPWILINFAVGLYFKFPTIIAGGSSYVGKIQDQIDIAHGVPGRYGGFLSHTTIERM